MPHGEFKHRYRCFTDTLRHKNVIRKQLLFSNDRNRVRWAGLSQAGVYTDSFENLSENSLKGDQ